MIKLGLRLTVNGGREAVSRLIIIALAVMVGVGMLLATVAGINAVNAQNARYAWLATGSVLERNARIGRSAVGDAQLGLLRRADHHARRSRADRADVAGAAGHPAPARSGPVLCLPGDVAAAAPRRPPASSAPAIPGQQIGTIGAAALPAPDSLIIIVGDDPSQLSHVPGAVAVRSINTKPPNDCGDCAVGVGINANGIDLILGVVAAALLFPLLIFVDLGDAAVRGPSRAAVRRDAADRCDAAADRGDRRGRSRRRRRVSAWALGFGLFYALRDGDREDPVHRRAVLPERPVAESGRRAAGRDRRAAGGNDRGATRVAPRADLAAGREPTGHAATTAGLPADSAGAGRRRTRCTSHRACFAPDHPRTGVEQVAVYLPGFLVVMAGLVIAGPWLTMVGSKAILRRTRRPATLIAGRRLADNPQTGFRAISGLVLALFVTSVAVGVITTFVANRGAPAGGSAAASTLVKDFNDDRTASGRIGDDNGAVGASQRHDESERDPGRRGRRRRTHRSRLAGTGPDSSRRVWCHVLSWPAFPGSATARPGRDRRDRRRAESTAASSGPDGLAGGGHPQRAAGPLPVQALVVGTNGSTAAIEQARTVLEAADPYQPPPNTINEFDADNAKQITEYQQLANVVILTSLPIAGCSLAASIAAGLSDRRRPFSLLRLTGVPIAVLRRVVALESAVPLLIAAVVSIAMGFLAAQLFLRSQLGYTLRPPGLGYYLIVAGRSGRVAGHHRLDPPTADADDRPGGRPQRVRRRAWAVGMPYHEWV